MAYLERVIANALCVRVAHDTDRAFAARVGVFERIVAGRDTLARSRELMAQPDAMLARGGAFIQEYYRASK
jgi:hypothetical protein